VTGRSGAGSPISPETAIRLLRRWDLLTDDALVDGDVWVTELRGRNVNLQVVSSRGPGFIIKQVPVAEPARPLAVEAWFYGQTARPAYAALRSFVPRFHRADRARRLIVLGLEPGAVAADHLFDDATGRAPPRIGAPLGEVLGALHRAIPFAPGTLAGVAHPWILDIIEPKVDLLRYLSPAQLELIRLLQAQGHAAAAFARLRAAWTPASLIHGDVKWSNVLVTKVHDPPDIRLIDWECAAWGDPAWDVGSALHSFMVDAIAHAAVTARDGAAAAAAFAHALPRSWPEIRAFLDAYVRARGLRGTAVERCVSAAVVFSAVRLVQTAWESCERAGAIPHYAAGELQLAFNVLARPDDARVVVLGLDASVARA